ncbi:MAG: N-acetyltransferase [Pseudomonadota bacterium]|nr:N-acetyltransferase [Pseudomonadota bacterium]
MSDLEFTIRSEIPELAEAVAALNARAFGPGRFARSAYRVREGTTPVPELCLTGWREGRLVGSIRFTAVEVGGAGRALLLGPLVVEEEYVGRGCGRRLVAEGMERARKLGYRLVLLVGDMPYYGRFGFNPVPVGQILFPGPVDPARILFAELEAGALADYRGPIRGEAQRPSRYQVKEMAPSSTASARKPEKSGISRTPRVT